jgi:tripartite-type tricarboxylate transporter receptor subunit TctC
MRHVHCRWLAAAAISLMAFAPAQAQYPNKPVRLILPFPPGGAVDTLGRIIGPRLSEALGQQVVMENRPGATGNIGAELVAKSPPDGYTVLMGAIPLSISVSVYSKLGFDPVKDLAPVSLLASTPNVVVVHPSVPAKSVKELIALARARPGQLDFSSSGAGGSPHLAGALFNNLAGTRMNHIPYKGGGPAVIALVAGEVSVGFATAPSVIHHVKSARLRGLAVTSAQRAPLAPDLPTVSEAGLPGYEAGAWQGLLVPAGTRREIISRLQAESSKVLKLPDVKERLDATGLTPIGSTPEEFGAYLRSEIEKWGKVVRSVGMRVD